MIPDIAVIISAYAIARLTGEYVLPKENQAEARVAVAIGAAAVIAYFLYDIYQISSTVGNGLGGLKLG